MRKTTMFIYVCERCKKQIEPTLPVYELNVIYDLRTGIKRSHHYHWKCLKEYVEEDE